MVSLKNLPIGMQTFADIINGHYIYVDKTRYIYDLITTGKVYFLSRPRRFGKSLLISTLQALFEGRRELFTGLAIDNLEYAWVEYPVIKLAMPTLTENDDYLTLRKRLQDLMLDSAKKYNFSIPSDDPGAMLKSLINQLKKINKVVVLIDEYDRPILDVITSTPQRITEIKSELHSFYSVLKDMDDCLHFVFVTGISRFSRTSIFSGLNHLRDISFSLEKSTLLGYTDEEMDYYFSGHCKALQDVFGPSRNAREELRAWYNGYLFHHQGNSVYNPFSVLNVLKDRELRNYWFATGTPTFLTKIMATKKLDLKTLNNFKISARALIDPVIEKIDFNSLLFQAGYATIASYKERTMTYYMRMPNREVHLSMFDCLLEAYTMKTEGAYEAVQELIREFEEGLSIGSIDGVMDHMKKVYATIPYNIHVEREAFYQTILYAVLLGTGFDLKLEDATSLGLIDMVLTTDTHIYIFELKLGKSAGYALAQIKSRNYWEKYGRHGKIIVLVGIGFSAVKKNITKWLVEVIS